MVQSTVTSQEKPEERLRLFIEAMEKWESESWQAMKQAERSSDRNSYEGPAKKRLGAIFQEFCTPKERPRGRGEDLAIAHPSDYCSAQLVLTPRKLSAGRAVFVGTSAQRGLVTRWVFVISRKTGGGWWIARKR